MTVINPLQHPQALFVGFAADDPRLARMQRLVGTYRVRAECNLDGLRPADWDVLVIQGQPLGWRAPGHIQVLAFATPDFGRIAYRAGTVVPDGKQPSRTLHVGEQLTDDVRRLITTEALPWLEGQEVIPYLQLRSGWESGSSSKDIDGDVTALWDRFVTDADGNVVLGAFPRGENSSCWAVPYSSDMPDLWLAAALQAWRKTDAGRFPDVAPWRAREPWVTSNERRLTRQLDALAAERDHAVSEFDQRELELRSAAQDAQLQAEQGPRRLLTAQSEDLVDAVKDAFGQLGYLVTDVDEERGVTGMVRVEDLHLTDPDKPERRIIAEVKGYTAGAKARDLIQISQHVARYIQREGVPPDQSLYVVNQFLGKDPDLRHPPLVGDAEGVDAFADGGGLIIDTRALFQLAEMVTDGRRSQGDARLQIASQLGVFDIAVLPDDPLPGP